jgi:hypothetical protein
VGNPPVFKGTWSQNLRSHFQFHCGCDAADAHVRAVVILSPEPLGGKVLGLPAAVDDVLVQPFVPDRAIVAIDVGVLLRLTRLDVRQGDAVLFRPIQLQLTDVFRAVTPSECR